MIFKFKIFKMMFKTDDYQKFLSKLSSFISVDSRILDNLIKLKLIHTIFKNPEQIHISENFFSFSNRISLKENYKSIPDYIFASYPLYNNDFQVLPFNQDEHSNKYQLKNVYSEPPIILYLHKTFKTLIDIEMTINLQTFTDKNIKLLCENEILDLKKYIIFELSEVLLNYSIQSFDSKHQQHIFFNTMCINIEDFDFLKLNSYFEESNVKLQELIFYFKNTKKSEIDKIFEPALLRNEMNNF